MNTLFSKVVMLLALPLSATTLAMSVHTDNEVRAALTKQGYTQITNVRLSDGVWAAEARAQGSSEMVKLSVNPDTGSVHPDQKAAQKSPLDILQAIQAAGYTDIGRLSFSGGVWKTGATNSTGQLVMVKVDPSSAQVAETVQ